MRNALKLLRTLQLTLLGSIVLYAIVGEVVGPFRGTANPTLSYVLTTVGVAVVGMILVVRRTLVLRSATTLAERPEDALTLNHWKTGYIATYALCETLSLFGLILRFMGFGLQHQGSLLGIQVAGVNRALSGLVLIANRVEEVAAVR